MEIDSVIFDLDGTLVDSLADIANAMNDVLRERNLPTHGLDAYRRFVGEGVRRLVERATAPSARHLRDELVAAFRARYVPHMLDESRPYAGVAELLRDLGHRGITMAVLSNKPHDATLAMVQALFPDASFAVVRGHREGEPTKPDPKVALEIAGRLGSPPERCAFVGDTKTDMRTAVAAGMVPIGVLWGFRDAEELLANGATHLATRPGEISMIV